MKKTCFALGLAVLGSVTEVLAAPWRPLCFEGSTCSQPLSASARDNSGLRADALAPFGPPGEVWLPLREINPADSAQPGRYRIARFSPGSGEVADVAYAAAISDYNAVAAGDGTILVFRDAVLDRLSPQGDLIETVDWSGWARLGRPVHFIGPPVRVGNYVYAGRRSPTGLGPAEIYRSADNGRTWVSTAASLDLSPSGQFSLDVWNNQYNLSPDPEGDGLWMIGDHAPGTVSQTGLHQSGDHGDTWRGISGESYPANTRRLVLDPDDSHVVFAVSASGLYASRDRGSSWQPLYLDEPVYGLSLVPRNEGGRALVLGTATGVRISVDEGASWRPMSDKLLAVPHSVLFTDGLLLAVSDAGYFSCPGIDCFGAPTAVPPDPLTEVTEFHNSMLDHYFMTPDPAEAAFVDSGGAGPGWRRTGQRFTAWARLGSDTAVHVCRFYGSVSPGPNSHFYTASPGECASLIDRQAQTPASAPRWNLEEYSFMAVPPVEGACPADLVPVYRAYNNGFPVRDSNHRFVTDRALLAPLVAAGWMDEGVAFCVAGG